MSDKERWKSPEEAQKWINAGIKLASNPKEEVACPHCGQENLQVLDVEVGVAPSDTEISRYMVCPKCNAQNILRIKK